MGKLTTGKLSKEARANIETIRYYERQGLIEEPPRSESGYRLFSEGTVERIRFIRNAQRLGFTLKEIKDILALKITPNARCANVKMKSEQKIKEIEEKINALQEMKRALQELSSMCEITSGIEECHILQILENTEENFP
jgi:MerR family mercuric resistance operon transcriptional regulator